MYSKKLLEEFYNPSNVGVIKGADAVGKVKDKTCGDIVKLYATIKNNSISEIAFQTYGSVVTIAGSSVATKLMAGKSFEEVITITAEQIKAELGGVSKEKMRFLRLVEEAIHSLIESYYKKVGIELPEEFKFDTIVNSDEISAEIEEEKPAKEEKAESKKPAKKAVKLIDAEEIDENDEIEVEPVEAETSKKSKKTSIKKTIEVYSVDNLDELSELSDLKDDLSDALKQLKDSNE